ncbi:hypothetical protein ACPTGE_30995, partial [Pseudomonas aeruginosa]|uniref:hypothetical protein n=1 Tax=Pseudomonas aeruginosa TaxID=287 RepID=UPI003CC5C420
MRDFTCRGKTGSRRARRDTVTFFLKPGSPALRGRRLGTGRTGRRPGTRPAEEIGTEDNHSQKRVKIIYI